MHKVIHRICGQNFDESMLITATLLEF